MRLVKLKRLVIALVLAIIVLQCFELRSELVSYAGASPLNSGWDGTSDLAKLIRSLGYNVAIVESWLHYLLQRSIQQLSRDCGIVLLISPERPLPLVDTLALLLLIKLWHYNIVIADEGPFSSSILRALNLDISIDFENMVRQTRLAISVIDGKSLRIVLNYFSPLVLGPRSRKLCRVIALFSDRVVGVMCRVDKSTVVVLGDGTLFINAVIRAVSERNPNVRLVTLLLRELCPGNGAVAINAVGYPLRYVSIEELRSMGLRDEDLLRHTLSPYRYLSPGLRNALWVIDTDYRASTVVAFIVLIAVMRIFLRIASSNSSTGTEVRVGVKLNTLRRSIDILTSMCREVDDDLCHYIKRFRRIDLNTVNRWFAEDSKLRERVLKVMLKWIR